MEAMHLLQRKLNDLLAKNASAQDTLSNENFNIETDLVERLKQRKKEAIELEEKIFVCHNKTSSAPPPSRDPSHTHTHTHSTAN